MAKGGFRGMGNMGGMGNINQIMAQAQKMQKQLEDAQVEIKDMRIDTTAGGGMIKLTIGGDHKIYALDIDKAAIDPEDKEGLEDLIMAAVNQAVEELDATSSAKISSITGNSGLNLPF